MARKTKGALPSGSIRYRLYIGTDPTGKKLYKSFTARTKAEALRMADQWKQDHRKQPLNASDLDFRTAADLFLANRSKTLSPSTLADYHRRVDWLAREYHTFSVTKLSVISSETVQAVINDMVTRTKDVYALRVQGKTSGQPLSPKTIRNYYGLISAVLASQGIELTRVRLPQKDAPELNIPENNEVKRLLEIIKGTELEVPVLLAAWGPMRRGEICALSLDDIDGCDVHVHKSMVLTGDGEWIVKPPKTTSGDRHIIYPQYVIDLIQRQGYVYQGTPNHLSYAFTRTLEHNGLERFRFHDLRHFAASFQIALGIPPEYVMERGGWHSPGTMQRYVHALDQQRREMASKANEAFAGLL